MASDFHTHNQRSAVRALISSSYPITDKLTSLEYHPWDLPQTFDPARIPAAVKLLDFSALGEIGLDKLHGPAMKIQLDYLQELLKLASDCRKPVIIHCVRAFQELFSILKSFNLKIMLHGFRSSPEILKELWKRNITVSFHHQAVNNPALMNKLDSAAGAFGFESDDNAEISIPDVINIAEKNAKIKNIESMTDQFFADFLEI